MIDSPQGHTDWHALPTDRVAETLRSQTQGLTRVRVVQVGTVPLSAVADRRRGGQPGIGHHLDSRRRRVLNAFAH